MEHMEAFVYVPGVYRIRGEVRLVLYTWNVAISTYVQIKRVRASWRPSP
jgi:hypothetical protein